MTHVRTFVASVLFSLSVPGAAFAQTAAEAATRRGLLEQAEQAANAGDHQHAVQYAEQAGRIAMTPSVRHFLAQQEQALGRYADALGNADLCVQSAQRDATVPNRQELIDSCRALWTQLQPLVARVTVHVATPAPSGLQISIAGAPISDVLWGAPYVVTPGHIVVDASAPGYVALHRELTVTAGASVDVPISLTASPHASSSPPPSTTASAAPASAAPEPTTSTTTTVAQASTAPESTGPGVLPIVVAGLGVVALGASAISWFLFWQPSIATLDNECGMARVCADTPSNRSAYNTAQIAGIVAPVTLVGGGVLLVGGILWEVLGRSGSSHREHASIAPRVQFAPMAGGGWIGIGGNL